MIDYRLDSPDILLEFLSYHESIKGHSRQTVNEYYLDLRTFFRFLKVNRMPELAETPWEEIGILDIDLDFLASVAVKEVYDYMAYLSRERVVHQNSDNSPYGVTLRTRARKISTIRSFYHYLTATTHRLRENPLKDIESPKFLKELPRYLTMTDSLQLLDSVEGANEERDFCILTLFLNCGLRISELTGLNIQDIQEDTLRVLGKGGKVRILYLNEACQEALRQYLEVRPPVTGNDEKALFVTNRHKRISRSAVHAMVKRRLVEAGLDNTKLSSHKLRHTAATLMLQNGVDILAVQEVLGHKHLSATQIYTHIDNEGLRVAAKANPLSSVRKKRKMTTDE